MYCLVKFIRPNNFMTGLTETKAEAATSCENDATFMSLYVDCPLFYQCLFNLQGDMIGQVDGYSVAYHLVG